MSNLKKLYLFFILVFFALQINTTIAFAQAQKSYSKCVSELPNWNGLVNDFNQVLNPNEKQELEKMLLDYEKESSNQITIVTVPSLCEMSAEEFSNEVGRKWGVGQKDKKNGVVVLVCVPERKLFLKPADGLSGVLPDVICSRIIRNNITPHFKNGGYFQGLKEGVEQIILASKGEFINDAYDDEVETIPLWVVILILLGLFFLIRFMYHQRKNIYVSRRGYKYGSDNWNFPGSSGGWIGGGWDDDNDSGGGFFGGGSSGGGFGGFGGGGGFSGGGAGGSW
jgi:uncharacterized protein